MLSGSLFWNYSHIFNLRSCISFKHYIVIIICRGHVVKCPFYKFPNINTIDIDLCMRWWRFDFGAARFSDSDVPLIFKGTQERRPAVCEKLVDLAKMHSSEAFIDCDDPLEVVLSVLVETIKRQEKQKNGDRWILGSAHREIVLYGVRSSRPSPKVQQDR